MERLINRWSAFFREHNIRAHIHIGWDRLVVPLALAIEKCGGVDIGYQWSASDFTFPADNRVAANHVFFKWGELFYELMIDKLDVTPEVVLFGGNPDHYLSSEASGNAQYRRQQLKNRGCTYVICLFDTSFGEFFHTPKMIIKFYESILELVFIQKDIGLIIKPKKTLDRGINKFPELTLKIHELINRGQCILLDKRITTYEASLSADITIGAGIHSAIVGAATIGIPAIHFNLSAENKHPLYVTGQGRFVFDDVDTLYNAIITHKENPDMAQRIGDHGEILDRLDPFRDGRAAERIGTYIRWFLEGIEKGSDWQRALADANLNYAQDVGRENLLVRN